MKVLVKVAIWLICLMFVTDWAFELITMGSTVANVVGFALAIATIYFSVTTKCFTIITLKRNKNEKNN